MTNQEKIGVGIIGVHPDRGWATEAHIPALRALERYEIRAVSGRTLESARSVAENVGAPLWYASYEELVASPAVDLVVVSVKVPAHKELVTSALEAGKAVFCEWILGNGIDETMALERLAREKGLRGAISLQSRGAPVIRYVRDLIAQGYAGEVLSTSLLASGTVGAGPIPERFAYLFDKSSGANLLTISVGHTLDAVCFCLGEFESLVATAATRRSTVTTWETKKVIHATTYDQVIVGGTLSGGIPISVHYRSGDVTKNQFRWEIQGTKKNLLLEGDVFYTAEPNLTLSESSASHPSYAPVQIPASYTFVPESVPRNGAFNVAQTYMLLANDLERGTSDCPTFADAVVRHGMLTAIERAARTGLRQSY